MCFELFVVIMGLEHPFSSAYVVVRMVWLRGKIVPFVRWLERCSMSIGLREDIGRRR
jgi:hypothetical protein